MSPKTSQLQIRVTPAEKATLKRLARDAGESLSSYVLSRALPRDELVFARLYERLADPLVETRPVLSELADILHALAESDAMERVPAPDPDILGPVALSMVAALVDESAHAKGAAAPDWTADVGPLPTPHFGWSLTSLKPHQLRVAPVAFKRRNVFFDPAAGPARPWVHDGALTDRGAPAAATFAPTFSARPQEASGARDGDSLEHLRALADLGSRLSVLDIEVEFYFLHGAVLFQAFSARPATAHIDAQFRPAARVRAVLRDIAASRGTAPHWVHEAVHALLRTAPRAGLGTPARAYVDLPGVRVFAPVPEYVLALKCAALRLGPAFDDADDLRFLARALNLHSAADVLDLVRRYFAERQLASDTEASLERLLSP